MAAITVNDLTQGTLSGEGIFDKLMASTKAHLQAEYDKSRIKGGEYATVYLGAMQAVMNQSLQFLLSMQKTDLEAQLMTEQLETENLRQLQIKEETQNLVKQRAQIEAQTLQIQEQTRLIEQQRLNAVTENEVLEKQICKLEAEFDLLVQQKLKAINETALLAQKKITEQAQTSGAGIDAGSVIGKQIALYDAQTKGFKRDAEQKATKILVDTWTVRQTTLDGGADPDAAGLSDIAIKNAIQTLVNGMTAA